jgi:hypothetical protein
MVTVTKFGALDPWLASNVNEWALQDRVDGGLLCPRRELDFPKWIMPAVDAREPNPP